MCKSLTGKEETTHGGVRDMQANEIGHVTISAQRLTSRSSESIAFNWS
jgi:hypothetical protein